MSRFPFPINQLDTPAILLDAAIVEGNIREMQALADRSGIRLHPHIKTHKSLALAKRQLKAGACGIAVAKLGEAEVMAAGGISDIQIANQVVGRAKIERMAALAEKIRINCAVDSMENLFEIDDIFRAYRLSANLLIEIDTGLHRSGLSRWEDVLPLVRAAEDAGNIIFSGLMTHAGHAYAAPDQPALERIGLDEGKIMADLANRLRNEGFDVPVVSVGSTPTAKYSATVPGVTELRVGNYIFNDAMQVSLGVAEWGQCALSLLATVISVHADRIVIDAGSKSFSSDAGAHGSTRLSGFGQVVGLPLTITRLSEEHGVIQGVFSNVLKVGERLRIIPNHACPVMNLAESVWWVDSGSVIERISIDARAKTA